MKKIPSLFKRDYEGTRLVYDEVVPGSEWVQNGEGIATIKLDGTSCAIIDGKLYKRFDRKRNNKTGKFRPAPEGAIPCEEAPNEHTGHWPHWVPCDRYNPEDKYHWEAWDKLNTKADGTYELIGPKINGNKELESSHRLVKHGEWIFYNDPPRIYNGLKEWFEVVKVEGIVWHHPDGRMVKIKRKDFGYEW